MFFKRFFQKKPIAIETNQQADLTLEKQSRLKVRIDGNLYELKNSNEFNLKEYLWMQNAGKKISEMSGKEYTDDMIDEMVKATSELLKKILLAPENVIDKLGDLQKIEIIDFFSRKMQEKSTSQKSTK